MLGEVRALRAVDAKWAFEEDASVSAELVPDPAHSREYVALAKHHNQHCAWNIGQVVPLSDRQVEESTVRDPSAAWLLNMTEDAAKERFRMAVSQIAIQQGPPASHCITAAYDSGSPRDAINMMGKLTCAILEANAYAMAHIDLAATARPISSPAPSTPLAPLSSPALSGPPTPIASSPLSGPPAPIAIPNTFGRRLAVVMWTWRGSSRRLYQSFGLAETCLPQSSLRSARICDFSNSPSRPLRNSR